MQSRLLVVVLAVALAPSLSAQAYESNFDSLNASTTGTLLTGQDGFYLPAVVGSIDWNAFTYAGNSLNIPQNLLGGSQFIAGVSAGGTALARAQRVMAFNNSQPWQWTVDFCVNFTGTPPAAEYIGSFSEQPSTTNANFNILLTWGTNAASPTMFNVGTQVFDSLGTAGAIGAVVPDPNFQNLSLLTWYRLEARWDFATNQVLQLAITNLTTFVRNTFTPTGWYLFGGAAGSPLPTDFRFFCGGATAGNVVACDNISITAMANYTPFGSGCAGSMGVPALAAAPNSLPIPAFTFNALVTNLPNSVGIMAAGFSNQVSGTFTLPLSLNPFGLTGCTLYVDPAVTILLLGASNQATWTLPLPSNPGLLHMRLYTQAFSLDTLANSVGLTVSNAATLVVGR